MKQQTFQKYLRCRSFWPRQLIECSWCVQGCRLVQVNEIELKMFLQLIAVVKLETIRLLKIHGDPFHTRRAGGRDRHGQTVDYLRFVARLRPDAVPARAQAELARLHALFVEESTRRVFGDRPELAARASVRLGPVTGRPHGGDGTARRRGRPHRRR